MDGILTNYWPYILILVIGIVIVLFICFNGSEIKYEPIGLKPLDPGEICIGQAGVNSMENINILPRVNPKAKEEPESDSDLKSEILDLESFSDSDSNIVCLNSDIEFSEREILTAAPICLEYPPIDLSKMTKDDASKGEFVCRQTLEYIYGKPFPKAYPDWLINPKTGRKLELDGYNEELGIAFEYHGAQHYQADHYFNRNGNYADQVNRDITKVDLCDDNGVYLITISSVKYSLNEIPKVIEYYLPENAAYRLYND